MQTCGHIQCFMFSQYNKNMLKFHFFFNKIINLLPCTLIYRVLKVIYRAGCDVRGTTLRISWAQPQMVHFGAQVA